MSNQKSFRPIRLLRPWDQPGYRDQDLVIQSVVDEIRRLESTKVATLSTWDVTEDTNGDLIVKSHTGPTVRLRLTAAGALAVSGSAAVSGAASIGGSLGVSGAAAISGAASVSGAASFAGTLAVSGAATFASTLAASGAAIFGSTVNASGAATLSSTLAVSGAATLGSTLNVAGAATVSGAATLNSTLTASGAATFGSSVAITGALSVTGTATLAGNLAHTGSHLGFFGATPQARPSAYTVTNATPIRSIDVATVTLTQLANLIASILGDFQARGDFQ